MVVCNFSLWAVEAQELGELGVNRATLWPWFFGKVVVDRGFLVTYIQLLYRIHWLQGLVLLNEPLDFIDHVLGALAVHVLLIFEHLVDALFLFVAAAIFFALLHTRLFGKILSRHFLNIVLRVKVILLFERDLVLRVDVQLEFSVSYGWLRVWKLG